ncbi:PLC-like phosphodiesterase [Pseudovirgaria hyperparasitica]|uniref:PLC-like phosphodiesterase n=1 Tax=Pseudovirgaria hyperparasitica TaxID=470096 RepID=A0A6A6WD69_9PEZI|nr:PLC-like phosphodiesterase [Pseudovirgaria hyperparasitica]KAF2759910.1 PLC-like phosphodiesterase [Pseudovirgaria hyperparasitica]
MHQSLPTIGNRKLKHICMPGSHDAAMSEYHPGTIGANYQNTQTQLFSFYDQLVYGSRFFDYRPVISNGQFVAGHYSEVADVWFGGNGQSMSSVIDQINSFTQTNQELIIIYLSHTLDTDNNFSALTQDQWNRMFSELTRLNHRFIPSTIPSDLTNLKLNDYIASSAAVLILAELPNGISLGNYASQGIYSSTSFPRFDVYANSDDRTTMENDQLAKLRAQRHVSATDTKDTFFSLSWTLTQQNPFGDAIVNLAVSVWDDLFAKAYAAFTPESYPNVLFLDAYAARDRAGFPVSEKPASVPAYPDAAALAVAVNFGVAGRNGFVTGE